MQNSYILRMLPLLIGLSGCLVACGSSEAEDGVASDQQPATAATPVNGIYLLRHTPVPGEIESMTALLLGTVVVVDGCLRVEDDTGGVSPLLIWPAGFELDVTDGQISVSDPAGRIIARVGEPVEMGGGFWAESGNIDALRELLNERLEAPIPEQCAAPFWLVGNTTPL